jgi:hypothetical protein
LRGHRSDRRSILGNKALRTVPIEPFAPNTPEKALFLWQSVGLFKVCFNRDNHVTAARSASCPTPPPLACFKFRFVFFSSSTSKWKLVRRCSVRFNSRYHLFGREDVVLRVATTDKRDPDSWVTGGTPMNLYSIRQYPDPGCRLHQVVADLLLGLRKPAIRNQELAVANLDGRRVARRAQTRARS